MQISHATSSTPGRMNEDCVATGSDWAVILDGATAPAGVHSGCATISIVRMRGDSLDYLTLRDSPIVLWHRNQDFTPIADDRTSHLPGGRPYTVELVRAHRNKAGGFWVASPDPEAAY